MSESDATPAPAGPVPTQPVSVGATAVPGTPATDEQPAPSAGEAAPAPPSVPPRPSVRPRPSSGPLTRMGPWAPVAGGLLGVVLGVVAAVLLAGTADSFRGRLSLVFLVVGLGLLGASGTLLADEVRLLRWRARESAVRPTAWIDTTAGLLNGLTPARLLLGVAGFVLFLAAWVSTG